MSDQVREAELREIIAQIIEADPETITPEANLVTDLGADSMAALEMMAAIEKRYGIVIEPEHFPEMSSLGSMASLVTRLVAER